MLPAVEILPILFLLIFKVVILCFAHVFGANLLDTLVRSIRPDDVDNLIFLRARAAIAQACHLLTCPLLHF